MPKPTNREYFSGIDGLRAVAVTLVVVFHFYEIYMPAGFVGVDMFFAVSGFLITGILLKNDTLELPDVLNFFWRRIARLYPALLTVLFAFVVLSFLGLIRWKPEPLEFASLALSFHNLYLIFNTIDYFQAFSQETPFLHFWSLGLEWQLYIATSYFVLTASLFRQYFRVAVLMFYILAFLGTLYLNYYFGYLLRQTDIAYYLPISHSLSFWGGGIAYFATRQLNKNAYSNILFFAIGSICLSLTILVAFQSDKNNLIFFSLIFPAYPFLFLASAILSFGLIVSIKLSATLNSLIGNPVFVWVGERSYGIYLWHYPMLILFSYSVGKENFHANYDYVIAYVICVLIVSDLSWRAIEDKFRNKSISELSSTISYKVIFLTASFVFIFFYHTKQTVNASNQYVSIPIESIAVKNTAETNETKQNYNDTNTTQEFNKTEIKKSHQSVYTTIRDCKDSFTAPNGKEITVIGDSVFLDAKQTLEKKFPSIYIDAKVSRQFHHLPAMLEDINKIGAIRKYMLIALGTNGFIYKRNLVSVVDYLSKRGATIIFIVPYAPEEWQKHNSQILREFASKYQNIVLIDWENTSKNESENVFVKDRTHLNSHGLRVYSKLVVDNLCSLESKKSNGESIEKIKE